MMGKPIVQSREEIDYSIARTKSFLEGADQALRDNVILDDGVYIKKVSKEPVRTRD